jgi:hypothetical protein
MRIGKVELTGGPDKQDKHSLLEWISKKLKGYFAIKRWLDENEISYT